MKPGHDGSLGREKKEGLLRREADNAALSTSASISSLARANGNRSADWMPSYPRPTNEPGLKTIKGRQSSSPDPSSRPPSFPVLLQHRIDIGLENA